MKSAATIANQLSNSFGGCVGLDTFQRSAETNHQRERSNKQWNYLPLECGYNIFSCVVVRLFYQATCDPINISHRAVPVLHIPASN